MRGIQFGLGLSLASLALKDYLARDGVQGYVLALVSLAILVGFRGNRKVPPALVVIGLGVIYAFATSLNLSHMSGAFGLNVPGLRIPEGEDILQGLWLLALPQIALSLSNSVIATVQTVKDLFPEVQVLPRRIGMTYSLMNLVAPFFGGIPVCHGSGGLMGHYGFGARTGGSVVIYGSGYLIIGLLFANGFREVLGMFPMPVLGIVLLFEGLGLMSLIRDIAGEQDPSGLFIALLVATVAFAAPQGFIVGLIIGCLVHMVIVWRQKVRAPSTPSDAKPHLR